MIEKQLRQELTKSSFQNKELKKTITEARRDQHESEEGRRFAENIVETIREPLLVLDKDLKIISANRSFYKNFKVAPDETIGCYIYDLGNKQWDIPELRKLLEEVLPHKESFDDYEVDHTFRDIGHRIMLLNARQINRRDISGKIILLAIEDITERKLLENQLSESEERFRRLFETASDGIVLLEKMDGKIILTNPASEKILGYTRKESIGNKLQDIGVMLEMGNFQAVMNELSKSGIINYNDVPITTKSGQQIYSDIYLVDRAKVAQCNIRDITQRKLSQELLLTKTMLLEAQSETSIDGMLAVNAEGHPILFNRRFGELWRMPQHILEARDDALMLEFILKQLKEPGEFSSKVAYLYKHHEEKSRDEIVCTDGRVFDRYSSPLLSHDKKYLGRIWFFRDITENKQAEEKLRQTLGSLKKAFQTIIQVMISAVEVRDPYTSGHQKRVTDLALAIAHEMELSPEQIEAISMAGPIHDIGKLSIPAELLSKPKKLTDIEFTLIKEHSRAGYEILKNVESPWPLAEIVYQHHERMNGSGYPRNLKGNEILMEARIMAVADVVESMASHRPYREALGIDAALEEIEKNKGLLFDTAVVDVCLKLFREKDCQLYAV